MTVARPTLSRQTLAAIAKVESRDQLSLCLEGIAAEAGASHYLLLAERHQHGGSQPWVVASNWIYDTVHLVGETALARLADLESAALDARARAPARKDLRDNGHRVDPRQVRALVKRHGHAELYALALHGGTRRCHVLLSSGEVGAIRIGMLPAARLACCYLLGRLPPDLLGEAAAEALSERERECLYWVSEGKTTGEVAVILGVTSNTVNSYLANAIQKFGASNRAMAIATAIRTGAI